MARLLRNLDYKRHIQDYDLDQMIESNNQILLDTEQTAQAEMRSYLVQRYRVDEIFTNTTEFDVEATYKAKNLVEYTADAFSAATTYLKGDRVLYLGYIYESINGSAAHAFNSSEWTQICIDKALFYVTVPESEYDPETNYAIGDKIWYKDKVYTCVVACVNILPTESAFWGTGRPYSINGVLPDETAKWTAGDNRNQQIVVFLMDIVIYHLLPRITGHNAPEVRIQRYGSPNGGGAIGWLYKVAHGGLNADLPVYNPERGLSMRYGNAGSSTEPSNNMLW